MPLLPPVTTATLPASRRVLSVCISFSPRDNVGQKRVEPIGGFVLNPMPRSRNHLEPGAWLDFPQCARAIIEVRVGGGVALSPNSIDARLHLRKRPGKGIGAREPPALDAAPRSVLRLDVDREFVDFASVGDHQRPEIMSGDRECLGLGSTLRKPPKRSRLTNQTETVRPDDREGAHAIAELRGDVPTQDASERKARDVQTGE